MAGIYINNCLIGMNTEHLGNIWNYIADITNLKDDEFYVVQNGKKLSRCDRPHAATNIHCHTRTLGGKGGFGSMLRAIGAQIEKTTNREACRDLSGRRLRDINEEKRLKAWLEKQADRDREAEERRKRKIEKLLQTPKHNFKDEQYEQARSNLTEKVSEAFDEGLKKVTATEVRDEATTTRKRKMPSDVKAAKKKKTLWIDDNITDSDSSSCASDTNEECTTTLKTSNKSASCPST